MVRNDNQLCRWLKLSACPLKEDARFLSGRGRYVADLELPRMLQVAFLRSPHAHARIGRIDMRAARRAPGVVACLTGEELRAHVRPLRAPSRLKDYRPTDFPALALGKVRHAGEAVAVVVAADRYLAEDALELITVEYASLPVVADTEAVLRDGAALVHEEAGANVLVHARSLRAMSRPSFAPRPSSSAIASDSIVTPV